MENPYTSPVAPPLEGHELAGRIEGRAWAVTGLVLMLGPLVGVAGSILGMMGAFDKLSESGTTDPTAVSESIGVVLYSTVLGLIAGLIGLILVVVAALVMKNRERWFFRATLTLSILWCLMFPIGTLAGGALIILFLTIRQEFGTTPP